MAASYRAAGALDGPVGEPGALMSGVSSAAGAARVHGQGHHGKVDLPVGVFRDKSIREAIEIYLGAGHRKQTNKEIAVGLQKGGIATMSANFEATVATALHRMKEHGIVLRFPDGWDLAASYPDNLRARLEKDAIKSTPRPKASKAKTAKRGTKAASGPKAIYIKVKKANTFPKLDGLGAVELLARVHALEIDDKAFDSLAANRTVRFADPARSVTAALGYGAAVKWYLNSNVLIFAAYEHTGFTGGAGASATAPGTSATSNLNPVVTDREAEQVVSVSANFSF